jgi:WD40 repeat protein
MAGGPRDLFAIAGNDGVVRVMSASTGQVVSECAHPQRSRPVQLAWSPWPRHLASRHEDGTIVVWDAETEVAVRIVQAAGEHHVLLNAAQDAGAKGDVARGAKSIAFSGNGKWLAVASGGRVHFFDPGGKCARELRCEPDIVGGPRLASELGTSCVKFAPGDQQMLVAAGDGTVFEYDVHGRVNMSFPHPQPVLGIAITDERLVTGSADGRVRTWSWDGKLIHRVGHGAPVEHLAFSRPGSLLATAQSDGTLSIWDREGSLAGKAAVSGRPVGICCTYDSVLTANQAGDLQLWSLSAGARGWSGL